MQALNHLLRQAIHPRCHLSPDLESPSQTTFVRRQPKFGCSRMTYGYNSMTYGYSRMTFGCSRMTFGYSQKTFGHCGTTIGCSRTMFDHSRMTFGYSGTTLGRNRMTPAWRQTSFVGSRKGLSDDFPQVPGSALAPAFLKFFTRFENSSRFPVTLQRKTGKPLCHRPLRKVHTLLPTLSLAKRPG